MLCVFPLDRELENRRHKALGRRVDCGNSITEVGDLCNRHTKIMFMATVLPAMFHNCEVENSTLRYFIPDVGCYFREQ
jgi:hypothetical protein